MDAPVDRLSWAKRRGLRLLASIDKPTPLRELAYERAFPALQAMGFVTISPAQPSAIVEITEAGRVRAAQETN